MRPTVSAAVSDRPISEAGLVDWANREAQPVLSQLRTFANARSVERATATTDGAGAYIRIWESPDPPTDATWTITATVAGMSSTAGGAPRAGYVLAAVVASVAGTVTLTGTTVLASHETAAGIDARFGVSGRTAYVEARDAATGAMDFVAVVDTTEVRFL